MSVQNHFDAGLTDFTIPSDRLFDVLLEPSEHVQRFQKVFDALKPGSHFVVITEKECHDVVVLLNRMAGFEVRDCLYWLKTSGKVTPVSLLRKPLEGNIVKNVLKWGTGGLNIDGCRVGTEVLPAMSRGVSKIGTFEGADGNFTKERTGRWPANLIHDGSDEVVGLFPERNHKSGGAFKKQNISLNGIREGGNLPMGYSDKGSAARFFQTCKTRQDLISTLETLICPKGGRIWKGELNG